MRRSDLYRPHTIGGRLKLYVDLFTKPALGAGSALLILCGMFYLFGALDVIHAARAVLWYLGGMGLSFLAIALVSETMTLVRAQAPARGHMEQHVARALQRGHRQHRSARRARRLRHVS